MTTQSEKQRAKQIIVEIVRQAGGIFDNKTNLYKAFYHAHLHFARHNAGLLSIWPIVRMPKGPGIHHGNRLLLELVAEGTLEISQVQVGRRSSFRFEIAENASRLTSLLQKDREAIAFGVEAVKGKTAADVSHDSHIQSHTWNDTDDGRELAIYADLLTPAEYQAAKTKARIAASVFGFKV